MMDARSLDMRGAAAGDTATAPEAPNLAGPALHSYTSQRVRSTIEAGGSMGSAVLFEVRAHDGVWRLIVDTRNGRTFANWRDGETLKPTRQGVTFPLERIGELVGALEGWERENAPYGPENGS